MCSVFLARESSGNVGSVAGKKERKEDGYLVSLMFDLCMGRSGWDGMVSRRHDGSLACPLIYLKRTLNMCVCVCD